jgi:phospholipid transport system substrate-binding protein
MTCFDPYQAPPVLFTRRAYLTALGALTLALATTLKAPAAEAQPTQDPKERVQWLVDNAFRIMRDEALKKNTPLRVQKLREVVDQVMDWPDMAKSSLGPHWRKLDDAQRAEFVNIFKALLANQYMNDVDKFRGTEKVEVREVQKGEGTVIVKTLLTTASNERVPINYTLHQASDGLRVNDFSVEGVSMVNHFRTTFTRFLVNKDFAALLKQLKQKLGNS